MPNLSRQLGLLLIVCPFAHSHTIEHTIDSFTLALAFYSLPCPFYIAVAAAPEEDSDDSCNSAAALSKESRRRTNSSRSYRGRSSHKKVGRRSSSHHHSHDQGNKENMKTRHGNKRNEQDPADVDGDSNKRRRDDDKPSDDDDETVGEEEEDPSTTPPANKKAATTKGRDDDTSTTTASSPESAEKRIANSNGPPSGRNDQSSKPKHQSVPRNAIEKVFVNPYRLPLHQTGPANGQLAKSKEALAKEAARNKRRQEELKQQLANQEAKRTGRAKHTNKKKMDEQEKRWCNQVSNQVKLYVWRIGKFCNNDTKLDNMTRVVMLAMKPDKLASLKGKHLVYAQRKWIAENRDLVRVAFNECRNYCANNLRDEVVRRGMANKPYPTTDQMLQCITRDPKLMESVEGRALFDEYNETWLKCCAFNEHWSDDIKYFNRISEARHDDDEVPAGLHGLHIEPGTEAFLYVAYCNGMVSRFQRLIELRKVRK